MVILLRPDLPCHQDRRFHHPQRLLLLLQREMLQELITLMQTLKKMGQSGKENLLLGEDLLHHEGDLLCLEELDHQDDQNLLFVVEWTHPIVAETHLLGGGLCLLQEADLHLHQGALDPLQGSHPEGCVEVQFVGVLLLLQGAVHRLEEFVVLEGLQSIADAVALHHEGLHARGQDHSHHRGEVGHL